jgi:hypothetical protein
LRQNLSKSPKAQGSYILDEFEANERAKRVRILDSVSSISSHKAHNSMFNKRITNWILSCLSKDRGMEFIHNYVKLTAGYNGTISELEKHINDNFYDETGNPMNIGEMNYHSKVNKS